MVPLNPTSVHRNRPLLVTSKSSSSFSSARTSRLSIGEVAGGTAAECTAVCCCCPCALLNILYLAVYKLPAGLCRRSLRRRRRQNLPPRRSPALAGAGDAQQVMNLQCDKDVMRLEKEMWDQFDGTGFWRSPSRREPLDKQHAE